MRRPPRKLPTSLPMSAKLNWRGQALVARKAQQLVDALTEIDLRIETEAKKELYPGHGKRTGTLQRAIQGAPATFDGKRVRGSVAVKGVPYALRIHKRYEYLVKGLERTRPQAMDIIRKHTRD